MPKKGTRRKFFMARSVVDYEAPSPSFPLPSRERGRGEETRPPGSDTLHSRMRTRKRWVQAVRNASPSDSVARLNFRMGKAEVPLPHYNSTSFAHQCDIVTDRERVAWYGSFIQTVDRPPEEESHATKDEAMPALRTVHT